VEVLVQRLADALRARRWRLATAESCTGGLIAATCTELAGSSEWFEFGFVTYSNAAKTALLGVPPDLLAAHGAVSEPVARAMAQGALARSGADVAVAVTGIAGPGGGLVGKPVGTVWHALAWRGGCLAERQLWPGDRAAVRRASAAWALRAATQAAQAEAA